MAKTSAGFLVYRKRDSGLEVFLVHPGGPFWAKKDLGAWSIPKGEFKNSEDPFETAKREFREETGFDSPAGEFFQLLPVTQKSGKVVYAWAVEGDIDETVVKSKTISIKWPLGRTTEFPEIDKAEWFSFAAAREKINPGQIPLLNEVEKHLS